MELPSSTPDRPFPAPLYLGLPFWGHKQWAGDFYRPRTRPKDHLSQYSEVFNTVEGNTTFYSLPSRESIDRWCESVPTTFRFCFKIPRWITHEQGLRAAEDSSREFFERMAPLGERLGPFLIQLPPSFGPPQLPVLDRYLTACPSGFHYAVEVRHPAFFESPDDLRLDELLTHHGAERCWMDTRALRSGDADLPETREARRKKPDVPVRVPAGKTALGSFPMIRFVGHPVETVTEPWVRRWTGVLAEWIREGRTPYFLVHLPDNTLVPQLALRIHESLRQRLGSLDPLPTFPADRPEELGGQLSLL